MKLYIIIIIFLLLINILMIKKSGIKGSLKKGVFYGVTIFLIMFAGVRYGIDTDYWNYYDMFLGKLEGADLGFPIIIGCFRKHISDNFNLFILTIALLSIGIKGFCISKCKFPFLGIFLYYSFYYIWCEWNIIRHGLAISFLFLAIYYLQLEKVILYFIFLGIAVFIHPASAIFILAFVFKNFSGTRIKYLLAIFLAYCVRVFGFSAIGSIIQYLADNILGGGMRLNMRHGICFYIWKK